MNFKKLIRLRHPRMIAALMALGLTATGFVSLSQNASAQVNGLSQIMDSKMVPDSKTDAIAGFIAKSETRLKSDVLKKMQLDPKADSLMLANSQSAGFGGAWVSYDPPRIVVATTSGEFDSSSFPPGTLEVRTVKKDLNTLRKLSQEILRGFRSSSSAAISVAINTQQNRVDVEGNEEVVRYIDSLQKPNTEISRTKKEIKGANVQGGEHNNAAAPLCTNGFSVRNSAGKNLVSTAGHCPWAYTEDKVDGSTESVSAWAEYCDVDTQLLNPASGASDGLVRNNQIKGWTNQLASSTYIYSYGRTSGWRYGDAGDVSSWYLGGGECSGLLISGRKAIGGTIDFLGGDRGGPILTDCGCGGFYAVGMISTTEEHYVLATELLNKGYSFATA